MNIPLQITFRHLSYSAAIESAIRSRAAKLDRFFNHIMSCRVVVEKQIGRHQKGNLYRVLVDISVPHRELTVSRNPAANHAHEDAYVAIRDAFNTAERRLQDHVRSQRVRVHLKGRERPPHGRVMRLLYEDGGYGFLETEDGREIYFDARSVLNGGFDQLEVGSEVRFSEEQGEEGAQASTVELVGKQGKRAFG